MTFKDIQDAVLADAFSEAKRASAKLWIQMRHAFIWDLEDWTFRQASATVTVTAGSQTVSGLPADFQVANALYNTRGNQLTAYRSPRAFQDAYNANLQTSTSGLPEAFTVRGSTMLVGPKSSETSSAYILEYERSKPVLSADGDSTGLPDGYDLALVHGAKAEGFKLIPVPNFTADFEGDFQAAIQSLRNNYLTAVRSGREQSPAYRPC
jgi:hypothetical protein